jgi:molybdate transport system substrate-binding protein
VRRGSALALALAVSALTGGCGGSSGRPALVVSAAASLHKAFTLYAQQFPSATVRFSFAGSDALAAQIVQGVRPDVFASANTSLPAKLYASGLVDQPLVFAANTLVLAVPASSKLTELRGVERPGVTIAMGTPTVPIGEYTLKILGRLPARERRALLSNVADREPDVSGIVGKLSEGAVDAGFLYATDVRATRGALRAIQLPARLQPQVAYAAAIVKGAQHMALAQAFLSGLLRGAGQRDLLKAGFLPPPAT